MAAEKGCIFYFHDIYTLHAGILLSHLLRNKLMVLSSTSAVALDHKHISKLFHFEMCEGICATGMHK